MQLTFLGTGSAEGHPNPFCCCQHCEDARRTGGRAIRLRCSALLDDDFLIDFGPDLNAASNRHGIVLNTLRYAAQTHPHDDHFYLGNFFNRSTHCMVEGAHHLQYTVSSTTADLLKTAMQDWLRDVDDPDRHHYPTLRLDLVIHGDWDTIQLGPYTLLAIPAQHAPGLQAHIFAIRKNDGPALLYATDTGPIPRDLWSRVRQEGWRFSTVVMDHNHGYRENSSVHHSSDSFVQEIGKLRDADLINTDTQVIATHFAHHSHPMPEELAAFAHERDYDVAWDGRVVDV